MLQQFIWKKFNKESLRKIAIANEIFDSYAQKGFSLILRQVYYQFVARNIIENSIPSYKALGNLISEARLAGHIDWNSIRDTGSGRNLRSPTSWNTAEEIIEGASGQFKMDRWRNQPRRIEVWIEKESLIGVISRACSNLDVPYYSCKGHNSQTKAYDAAMRMQSYKEQGYDPLIIYLGDHDPSGLDISRDIDERFKLFMGGVEVNRVALNIDQIREFNPPPNVAKTKDSRYEKYVKEFGKDCWELDSLDPTIMADLVTKTILENRDERRFEEAMQEEEPHIKRMEYLVRHPGEEFEQQEKRDTVNEF